MSDDSDVMPDSQRVELLVEALHSVALLCLAVPSDDPSYKLAQPVGQLAVDALNANG